MKTNNSYSSGSIKWEPQILRTYATYLAHAVEAFRAAGVDVYAVFPQNEPNISNVYPTCLWTGPQLREFIADYLGPILRDRKVNVELWLGTLNDGNINDRTVAVLDDAKANAFVTGVSFQYDARAQVAGVRDLYPDKKLMQSETECHGGANSWADAERTYGLMRQYIESGCGSYFAWNMVLDETGVSTWKWKQNALVTVNRRTGEVTFNGEYYAMRHFSQFVKPGAKRLLTTGVWGDKIAFGNPDGSVVMVLGNSSPQAHSVILTVAGRSGDNTLKVSLQANSINTFVVPP
jgi:glucosylceramidase